MPPVHFDGLRDYIISRRASGEHWHHFTRFAYASYITGSPYETPPGLYNVTSYPNRFIISQANKSFSRNTTSGASVSSLSCTFDEDFLYTSANTNLPKFGFYTAGWTGSSSVSAPFGLSVDVSMTQFQSGGVWYQSVGGTFTYEMLLSGRMFKCPLQLSAEAYQKYFDAPSVTYAPVGTIKPACKIDGSTYANRFTLDGGNTWNGKPQDDPIIDVATYYDYSYGNASLSPSPAAFTFRPLVWVYFTTNDIKTPTSDDERLAYFLINNGVDYRTGHSGGFIKSRYAYSVGDVVFAGMNPATSGGRNGTIWQCHTAYTTGSSPVYVSTSNWTDVTWKAYLFCKDPSSLVSWSYLPYDEVGGETLYGYFSFCSTVPESKTYTTTFSAPWDGQGRVIGGIDQFGATNCGSSFVFSKAKESKLCTKN